MDKPNSDKLIILDRDGVINQDSDAYIKSVEEFKPIAGSIEAIVKLYQQGYQIAIATNQSGIARGYFSIATLDAMHHKLHQLLKESQASIAHIAYCPHAPTDNCPCRKPKAGLIEQIEKALNLSAKGAYMVGDSIRDLQAGIAKGCVPILLKTGKGKQSLARLQSDPALKQALGNPAVFADLHAFVQHLDSH